jgi:hypothetical protein
MKHFDWTNETLFLCENRRVIVNLISSAESFITQNNMFHDNATVRMRDALADAISILALLQSRSKSHTKSVDNAHGATGHVNSAAARNVAVPALPRALARIATDRRRASVSEKIAGCTADARQGVMLPSLGDEMAYPP